MAPPATGSPPSPTSRPRVLVADDEPQLRKTLERALDFAGFEAVVVHDGKAAERALSETNFDVILTDIGMPDLDGIELLRLVRAKDLDVPVILMTGNPDYESAAKAVELGAMKYVVKPFRVQEIIEQVAEAEKMHRLARLERDGLRLLGHDRASLAADRAGLEASYTRAINSLWMAFQPVVDWPNARVFGYEALMRCDDGELRSPLALLDAVERLDRVHELGRTVRERIAESVAELGDDQLVFVNLHPADLDDPQLYDPKAPLTALSTRVVLEITERARVDPTQIQDQAKRLRDLGYRLAIDDLGAGYSGLHAYVQLSPEVVKLDGALVRGVATDERRRRVIAAMLELSQSLGNLVVLEGVETAEELRVVTQMGAQLLQGYALARPGRPFPAVDSALFRLDSP